MKDPVPVFIGYDPREAVAWHVCVQSILDTCSEPDRLQFHAVTGERRDGSNDFVYARFLVPYLCGFKGYAVFLDGDMIVRSDIMDLWSCAGGNSGVHVVKHDYKTKHPVKYLRAPNEDYPRKNWSSVMLWTNWYMPNRILTPDFVRQASGAYLHRFQWLRETEVGELPAAWNRLVLEQDIRPDDKLLHYTIGIPAFTDYKTCDGASEWWATYKRASAPIEHHKAD